MAEEDVSRGEMAAPACRDDPAPAPAAVCDGPVRTTCICGKPIERVTVTVKPTTGGQFCVTLPSDETVEHLKLIVSQKLKLPRERICLLYRNRPLRDGTLEGNQVSHGCQLTLLPSVESGLMSHRPEQSVMQALENLTPSQVTEFLSGKAPLNLTVRLGDHMMLIQLQLSPAQTASRRTKSPTTPTPTPTPSPSSPAGPPPVQPAPAATEVVSRTATPAGSGAAAATATAAAGSERRPGRSCHHQRQRSHEEAASLRAQLDMRALTEASRNLTRTLKQLSSEVLTGTGTESGAPEGAAAAAAASVSAAAAAGSSAAPAAAAPAGSPHRRHPGAIIESMHHHGKGVYSGTFSGTLNPALQDKMGRPKRDISTIIHILNDLLCAAPQYRTEGGAETADPVKLEMAGGTPVSRPQQPAQTPAPVEVVDENQATRGKVERLKLVMEERRQRRRQRRTQRSAPYTTSWSATSETGPGAAEGALIESMASEPPADAEMAEVAPALVACGGQTAL